MAYCLIKKENVFTIVTPCSDVVGYKRFGGPSCFHFSVKMEAPRSFRVRMETPRSFRMKMGAARSFKAKMEAA
jgi:hypothetical protein